MIRFLDDLPATMKPTVAVARRRSARATASPVLALVSSIFFALAHQAPSRGQGEDEPAGPPPPEAAGEEFEVHLWPFIESVRLPSGAKRTSLFLVYHRTVFPSGRVHSFHYGPYFQGPDYKFLFPIAYRAGEHLGVIPFYFRGPKYKVIPPLLYGRWESDEGVKTTWLTPLFHKTVEPDGKIRHMHFLNYFQGRDWKVLLPLAYQAGEHAAVFPFYFRGPNYKLSPPLLSGWWRHDDGAESTWVTPLFHKTVEPDGNLRHMHVFNYFRGPNFKTLFPVYWQWNTKDGGTRSLVPLLYSSRKSPDGDVYRSVLPPLYGYHRGAKLDKSLGFQLRPFVYQRAGEDYEFNFLWRLFHFRREGEATYLTIGPFWRSERPAKGYPARFQVLGGLFARDCNYERGSYRYRILWLFPVGARRRFAPLQAGRAHARDSVSGAPMRRVGTSGDADAYQRGYKRTAGRKSRRTVERWAR